MTVPVSRGDSGSRPSQVPAAPAGEPREQLLAVPALVRVRRTTRPMPGLRANAATAAASDQTLNVACSPIGASPIATAARAPPRLSSREPAGAAAEPVPARRAHGGAGEDGDRAARGRGCCCLGGPAACAPTSPTRRPPAGRSARMSRRSTGRDRIAASRRRTPRRPGRTRAVAGEPACFERGQRGRVGPHGEHRGAGRCCALRSPKAAGAEQPGNTGEQASRSAAGPCRAGRAPTAPVRGAFRTRWNDATPAARGARHRFDPSIAPPSSPAPPPSAVTTPGHTWCRVGAIAPLDDSLGTRRGWGL